MKKETIKLLFFTFAFVVLTYATLRKEKQDYYYLSEFKNEIE
jgi:hypothetical protein